MLGIEQGPMRMEPTETAKIAEEARTFAEGIVDTVREPLFRHVFRVSPEETMGGRTMSTDLGLTFCKLAVKAHGGQVDVESVPGQGSTSCFTNPLSPPPGQALEP